MEEIVTKPFQDQILGTSGLRKKVKVFQQEHYLENFVQSIFDVALEQAKKDGLKDSITIVMSGDGRFYSEHAGQVILSMAKANGIKRVIVGVKFLLSTPAVSTIIRKEKALGGIILTASHNPGGPSGDFGIKWNISNGGAAPEAVTDKIYARSKSIRKYKLAKNWRVVDVDSPGRRQLDGGAFIVDVVDPAQDHVELLKEIFDFPRIKDFIETSNFKLVYDAMHGVAGPTANRIFVDELGLDPSCILNGEPQSDFAGGHPDPNLTYAKDLVRKVGLDDASGEDADLPDFGAAGDGDMDRNMIVGKRFFVTPSDSVAIIASYAVKAIPYFEKNGLSGVARSMPTSGALDRVAEKLEIPLFETPTGWKFFGNLLDADKIGICGEESFGTGASHIREKDGMFAVLAWLAIIEYKNRDRKPDAPLVSVADIVTEHWATFGRNFYTRYDYEEVDAAAAKTMMQSLKSRIESNTLEISSSDYIIEKADQFKYIDPIDGSVSENQGTRILFSDGSRIIFRLSGTGSVGATIRVYIEQFESDPNKVLRPTDSALRPLIQIALEISQLQETTGRDAPSVIT